MFAHHLAGLTKSNQPESGEILLVDKSYKNLSSFQSSAQSPFHHIPHQLLSESQNPPVHSRRLVSGQRSKTILTGPSLLQKSTQNPTLNRPPRINIPQEPIH